MEETTFYITNLDVFGLLIIFILSEASIFLLNVLKDLRFTLHIAKYSVTLERTIILKYILTLIIVAEAISV